MNMKSGFGITVWDWKETDCEGRGYHEEFWTVVLEEILKRT